MKYIKMTFLVILVIVAAEACRKDFKMAPVAGPIPTGNISFDTVILPILVNSCAKSGCHVSGGQTPDLSSANAYAQLTGLGYVPQDDTSETNAKNSILYKMITSTSKPMPPTNPLSATQTAEILAWIKQGSQKN